jgi:hypothetical protein
MSKEQSAESDARPDKKKKKDVERATVTAPARAA